MAWGYEVGAWLVCLPVALFVALGAIDVMIRLVGYFRGK